MSHFSKGAWFTLSASFALVEPTMYTLEAANYPRMGQREPLTLALPMDGPRCMPPPHSAPGGSGRMCWPIHASAPLWTREKKW